MAFVHSRGWQPAAGNILKAVSGSSRFGAYAVRFSGPTEKDLQGDYFTEATDFGQANGDGSPVLIHDGHPIEKGLEAFANVILPAAKVNRDERGLFASTNLDLEDPLHAAIAELIADGFFRWSSGSASQLVKRNPNGRLVRWPPVEFHSRLHLLSHVCRESAHCKFLWRTCIKVAGPRRAAGN